MAEEAAAVEAPPPEQGDAAEASASAAVAEAGAEDAALEGWITQTQATLGGLISKPRMLPDRLRKPPFRFLFDVAAEVARITGFGLQELFGGQVAEKPTMPSSRDDKLAFLDTWIQLVNAAFGEGNSEVHNVSAQNIVCGAYPEWTNYLLQCVAVIAFPNGPVQEEQQAAEPAATEGGVTVSPEEAAAVQAAATAAAAEAEAAAAERARQAAEAEAQREAERVQKAAELEAERARIAADAEAERAKNDAEIEAEKQRLNAEVEAERQKWAAEQAVKDEEERARQAARDEEFNAFLKDIEKAEANFGMTTEGWNKFAGEQDPQDAGGDAAATANAGDQTCTSTVAPATDAGDASPDSPISPGEGQAAETGEEDRPMTAAAQTLRKARDRTEGVAASVQQANDLLSQIETGLDDFTDKVQATKEADKKAKLEMLAAEEARLDAERRAAEEKLQKEQEEAERAQAEKDAAKAARRAAKEAKLEAERQAQEAREAEEKKAAMFPQSKHAKTTYARIVCSVGDEEDEEYEWDGDDDNAEKKDSAAEQAADAPPPEAPAAPAAYDPTGLGACLTDDLLAAAEPTTEADPMAYLNVTPAAAGGKFFDRLKAQLKDTFISFLCASMPESLLRKYDHDELIQGLQLLLAELRKCIQAHGLEDVVDEDPTSMSEAMREQHPHDWLLHLQNGSAWAFRTKYEPTEVVDTFQALCQTCYDRLTDAHGPVSAWAEEGSPLRFVASAVPADAMEDLLAEGDADANPDDTYLGHSGTVDTTVIDSRSASPVPPATAGGTRFDCTLGPALWEQQLQPPATASRQPPPSTAAPARIGTAAPVYDKTLGPAPWEVDGGMMSRPMPKTAAPGGFPGSASQRAGVHTAAMPGTAGMHRTVGAAPMRPATHAPRPGGLRMA
eukprot:TRINITY_DN111284_c0_g1_i1.p1 TRINITY_DN111284_c0_g1~~TRINITY_DN111284_c0_g1_i1.p1  ORF type:complete len:900 (-),score=313.65 TRINITY_DN111284_c0_g1_i1:143-2842(-)